MSPSSNVLLISLKSQFVEIVMRRFLMLTSPVWITVGILALVILRPSAAQDRPVQNPVEVKDLAELFPTRTVAYVETKDIKAAVKEFRAVLKGSFIDDMPASLEKFMGDDQDFYRGYESRILALYFSAESLDEISRLKGGALALVDNPKDFHAMPNFLGVLLTGDSNLVHLSARSLLNFSRMRVVATVEGVKIYREPPYRNDFRDKFDKVKDKPFDFKDKDLDRDEKFQVQAVDDHDMADARHSAPALALMPGAIIIGSQTKEVSDLIRRLKGKNAGPTLASNSEFKKHTNLRKDPGLFAFANLETVATLGRELIFSGSRSNKYRDKRFPDEKDFPKDKDFPFEDFKDKKLEQVSAQGRGGRDERPKDSMTEIFASLAKSFKTIALGL